jgi:hypothetical protein
MEGITYRCRGRGALLSLPHGGHRKDIIRKKAFEDYIRDHVVSWFTWTQDNKQGVERIEELILVSGCTLTTSWAVAAFVDNTMEAEISLASRMLDHNGGASFIWNNMRGPVRHNNSRFDPVSLSRVSSPLHALTLFVCCMESKIHQRFRTSASSSRVSERNASSFGLDKSKLPQNLFQTTLTTAAMMKYR